MNSISVLVRLVDGSLMQFDAALDLLERLNALQAQGLRGKQLIHQLLSDDWGPPPLFVEIVGTSHDGKQVKVQIPYS